MDALVCEVTQKQALYQQVYDGQIRAWGNTPQGQSFAADQAHAAVQVFQHPKLKANWDTYSWWLGDKDIPPSDWPELVKNYEQLLEVWNEVPWPRAQLNDLFIRCMRTLDFYNGFTVSNAKLYVNRFSGYWPKSDEDIRRRIALISLEGMITIYQCMEHKIQKKMENEQRKAKKWGIISMAAGMLFTGNVIASTIFKAATEFQQFNSAEEFSKFMMGYAEFVEECYTADKEDFTCTYLAPYVLWAMETLLMGEFFDWVAIEAGLPGAREGLTQEEVIEPMAEAIEATGVEVPKAAITPGGVAKGPSPLLIAGGIGAAGLVTLLLTGVIKV